MWADRDCIKDGGTDQRTDNRPQPPQSVNRIAICLDVAGAREHECEENKNGDRSRVDQNLHDSNEFRVGQQVNAGCHREDDDQGQCAVDNVIQSHYQQSGTNKYHSDDPKYKCC